MRIDADKPDAGGWSSDPLRNRTVPNRWIPKRSATSNIAEITNVPTVYQACTRKMDAESGRMAKLRSARL